MLKLLKFLFYLVVTVAIIIVAGSFLLPAEAVVTRSTEIAAPPDKVFAIVSDLNRLKEYSPWHELDPDTKYTFEGPATGVGQKMVWASDNANVGSGSQTITKLEPPKHVESELDLGPSRRWRPGTWSRPVRAPRRPGASVRPSMTSPRAGSA